MSMHVVANEPDSHLCSSNTGVFHTKATTTR